MIHCKVQWITSSAWLQLSLLTWKSAWTSTGLMRIHASVKHQPIFKALCNEFWSWISDSDHVIFYGVFLLQNTRARNVHSYPAAKGQHKSLSLCDCKNCKSCLNKNVKCLGFLACSSALGMTGFRKFTILKLSSACSAWHFQSLNLIL